MARRWCSSSATTGDGFAADRHEAAVAAGHIGLATSAERAAAVGGTFEIASAPGAGTKITVRLPADDASAA